MWQIVVAQEKCGQRSHCDRHDGSSVALNLHTRVPRNEDGSKQSVHSAPVSACRQRRGLSSELFEQDFRHHALVLVAQEMTVENRHPPNDGIGEVHDEVHCSTEWDIHGIKPFR